ncbi:hypothetical protein GGX14DRAFT_578608 [Mycena pura]|uniref:Uncharacterized protein n=1 Tax=Mycena pura TaxID=153505 RepID=A0AAD6UPX5_9AGAR|nr:hypothetical protein GGX14DRAFT_578608 [Mycena pura]
MFETSGLIGSGYFWGHVAASTGVNHSLASSPHLISALAVASASHRLPAPRQCIKTTSPWSARACCPHPRRSGEPADTCDAAQRPLPFLRAAARRISTDDGVPCGIRPASASEPPLSSAPFSLASNSTHRSRAPRSTCADPDADPDSQSMQHLSPTRRRHSIHSLHDSSFMIPLDVEGRQRVKQELICALSRRSDRDFFWVTPKGETGCMVPAQQIAHYAAFNALLHNMSAKTVPKRNPFGYVEFADLMNQHDQRATSGWSKLAKANSKVIWPARDCDATTPEEYLVTDDHLLPGEMVKPGHAQVDVKWLAIAQKALEEKILYEARCKAEAMAHKAGRRGNGPRVDVNSKENRAALAKRKRERVGEDEEMEDGELDTNNSRAAKCRAPDSPGVSEGAPSHDAAAKSSTSVPAHTAPIDAAPAPAAHSITKSSSGGAKPKPKKPAGRRVPTAPKASASTTNPTQHASDPVVPTPSGHARYRSKKPADLSINTAITLSPNSQAIIDKAQNDIEMADGTPAPSA